MAPTTAAAAAAGCSPTVLGRGAVVGAAVTVNLVAAGYDLISSSALTGAPTHPFVFAFARDVCASALLIAVAVARRDVARRRGGPAAVAGWRLLPHRRDVGTFLAAGLLGVWGAQAFTTTALTYAAPAYVAAFVPVSPAVTLLASLALGHESFSPRAWPSWAKVGGVATTLAGGAALTALAFTSSSAVQKHSSNLPAGVACLLTAKVLCLPAATLLQKRLLDAGYRASMVAAAMYAFGTAALLCSVVPLVGTPAFWEFPRPVAAALAYAVLLASALNFSAITFVNKRLNPVLTTSSYPLESVFAAALCWGVLGQRPTPADVAAGGAIIAGLLLTVAGKWAEGYAPPYEKQEDDGDGGGGGRSDAAAGAQVGDSGDVTAAGGGGDGAKVPLSPQLSPGAIEPLPETAGPTTTRRSAPTPSGRQRRAPSSATLTSALISDVARSGSSSGSVGEDYASAAADEGGEAATAAAAAAGHHEALLQPASARGGGSGASRRSDTSRAAATRGRHRHRSTVFIDVDDPEGVGVTAMEVPVTLSGGASGGGVAQLSPPRSVRALPSAHPHRQQRHRAGSSAAAAVLSVLRSPPGIAMVPVTVHGAVAEATTVPAAEGAEDVAQSARMMGRRSFFRPQPPLRSEAGEAGNPAASAGPGGTGEAV